MPGKKFDGRKLRWSLLVWEALEPVVRVLEFGCRKYAEKNWQKVVGGERRYREAAYRHLIAFERGEEYDKETGECHLAHALCSLMFTFWHHQQNNKRRKK